MTDLIDKFKGEPRYVSDFWNRAQLGLADEVDGTVFKFLISKVDSERYPELKPGMRLLIAESTDGFIFSEVLAPRAKN